MKRLLLAGVILCMVALWFLPAFAHTAPSGWAYSDSCCSGEDCAPVHGAIITATPEGWRVRLQPGDHPLVTAPIDQIVPYGSELPSGDGEFHVCIYPQNKVRCLYVPKGDVGT